MLTLLNMFKTLQPSGTDKKELYEKIDDYIKSKTYSNNFGVFCFICILLIGIQVLHFLGIDVPILVNMRLYFLFLQFILLMALIKPSLAPIISIAIALLSSLFLIFDFPNLVFKHQYSYISGYMHTNAVTIVLNPLGKYKDIGNLGIGLLFCYYSYNGEDKFLFNFILWQLIYYCTLHTIDSWHQRKLIESTSTFAINAENELKTKRLMEKLFHKPSFMTNSQLNTLHFCSLTYNTIFSIRWNELLDLTSVIQIQEIDQFIKAQNILENPLTLHQYIHEHKNNIIENSAPISLIGFVPAEHITNVDTKAYNLFAKHNFVPFQIKVSSVAVDDEVKYFFEYDAKAVDEILAARALEKFKENIISSVSHDVNTPISSSLNYCAQMKSYNKLELIKSTVREVDQQIHKAHFNLSLMMLNARAIKDNDDCTPNISCFGAHRLVRSLCKILNIGALGKNVCLNICSDERFTIFNDKEAFLYVNYILISNAITHTNDGCVNVILKPILPMHNNGVRLVEVSIEDEGVGMESNVVKQIEENDFFQLGNNNSLQGGFLGLSNAIKLLKKISPPNSKLRVQSTKGKGTTFSYQVYHRHPAGKYHEKNQRDDIPPEDPSDDDAPTTNLFELNHVRENPEPNQPDNEIIDLENVHSFPEEIKKSMADEKNLLKSTLDNIDENESQPEKKLHNFASSNQNNASNGLLNISSKSNGSLKNDGKKSKEVKCLNQSKSVQPNILTKLIPPTYLNSFEYKLPKINITKEKYQSLHIVVVDDCFFNVEILYLMLQTFSIVRIHKAFSSPNALQYLMNNAHTVDMIFTDYQMPEMNGYELICRAKELNLLHDSCRNILVTAACAIKLECFEKKVFHSFLKKPFKHQQVLNEVLEFLIKVGMKSKQKQNKNT